MDNEKKPQNNGESKPHGSPHHHKKHKKKHHGPRPDANPKTNVTDEKVTGAPAVRESANDAQGESHKFKKNRRRRGKGQKHQDSPATPVDTSATNIEKNSLTIDSSTVADESIYETPIMQKKETPDDQVLVEIIGIRFKAGGKTYYFEPNGITAPRGSYAIVETARGLEYGEVATPNSKVPESETVPPLRPVIRLATEADKKHHAENKEKEEKAFSICNEKILAHGLDMKLIDAQ